MQYGQQRHIMDEKNILVTIDSKFILRLHKTYKGELFKIFIQNDNIEFKTKSSFTCLLMLTWEVTCGEHCIQKAHSMIMLLDSMLHVLLKHSTIFTSDNMFTG